jgi:electron transfer flavoprotein alpha subunit
MAALVIAEHDNVSLKAATLNTVTAALQCGGEAVHGFLAARIVTTLVVAAVLIGALVTALQVG